MKTRILFVLMVLMSLALVAPAQTKKPASVKATKMGKTMPMRDPKTGRFMKAPTKALPPRDPKTGRFMKKSPKAMPMRDAKTGRFVSSHKKTGATKPAMGKKPAKKG